MTPLRQHMIAALHLNSKSERTPASSVREVRLLAQCYHTAPDRISAQALQRYFLHRKNVDNLAPASMRICYSGIRFFSQHVLQRDWPTLVLLRAQTTHRLPAVLSVEEVKRLLTSAPPCTTKSTSRPSIAWASGFMKPSSCRSLTLTGSASRSMSTAARAPRTGMSPCPKTPSCCSAPTGKPIVTRLGSFPRPGAIKSKVLQHLRP